MSHFLFKYQRLSSSFLFAAFIFWSGNTATVFAKDAEEGILNWYPRPLLTEEELKLLPSFCHGAYRIPDIESFEDDHIEAESDHSEMHMEGDARFIGNVSIKQFDRVVTGDEAIWNPNTGQGKLHGNVTLTNPQIVLLGQRAEIDNINGVAEFYDAQYSLPSAHMRGQANYIRALDSNQLTLKSSSLTFCEPGHDDWDIAASTLHLNNETGMGSAWNTRLRIQKFPVFYMPYYYFPLDDRRLTGFLDPQLSFTGKLQASDIRTPFYINIHPQMDATITPHYVRERGTILETQFRHLTSMLGEGELNYALLEKDETLETKRWFLNYKHQGQFARGWSHDWLYNQVSDSDFLNDADPTTATDRSTHLPRRGTIRWNQQAWNFNITAEDFQTIDPEIALKSRPYARLPQVTFSYMPRVYNAWEFQQKLEATRFNRKSEGWIGKENPLLQNLTNFDSLNGDRLLSDSSLAYPMMWPFGFLTPKVEYRYRSYQMQDLTLDGSFQLTPELYDITHESESIGSARYSLDGGLYFERELAWLNHGYQQTFEPRVFYIYSPYVTGQQRIPNFDSADITVTYNSLFMGERFTGGDRLADLNQVSLGATTRFIREDGLEQLRLSFGQIFYFRDREVKLDGGFDRLEPLPSNPNTPVIPRYDDSLNHTSSMMAEAEWNPNEYWSFMSLIEWDPYKNFARQSRHSIRLEDGKNHIFSLAYNEERSWKYNSILEREETRPTTAQVDAGIFWALSERWAIFGRTLVDVKNYNKADKDLGIKNENKPYHPVLESLAGFEYQNCCWRFQLSYRETSRNKTFTHETVDPFFNQTYSTEKDYSFMFSIQFKGLGTMGQKMDSLIEEGVPGYSRRVYHDF